ncbi:hypothetical protein ACIF8T_39835 [Streptomyces sp. NPDC085946]|uniref:hypothetical protein n=1 Tax=Streptomyces sp. NPDC085946 TaxID=3365744 RepID=UPI0037D12847
MRSYTTTPPVYDRSDPNQSGPLVVNYDLDQLKLGENWRVTGHRDGAAVHDRDLTPGNGWCKAVYAPECTWPLGAHLCVLVQWHPDRRTISDWDARLDAVATGLRSRGYIVERAGRPADPNRDTRASLLVYRMEQGKTAPQRPADAWAHVPPPRTYRWQERTPLDDLKSLVRQTRANRNGSHLVVWDIDTALWPAEASFCALLRWLPARDTFNGTIHDMLCEVVPLVQEAGYQTRLQESPVPDAVGQFDLLVYREPDSPAT